MFSLKKHFTAPIILTLALGSHAARAQQPEDCIVSAAQCFQINPLIIKAIIWNESRNNQHAIGHNKNNTLDVGIMQINSANFNIIKSKGITPEELKSNSCANIFAGTWLLNKTMSQNGYTWDSVGDYNSKTPSYHDAYVKDIVSTIIKNQSILQTIKQASYDTSIISQKFGC